MGSWLPIALEGLRRALPWVLERIGKGTTPDQTSRNQRIEHGIDRLHEKFDVQEKHLAALWEEMGRLRQPKADD